MSAIHPGSSAASTVSRPSSPESPHSRAATVSPNMRMQAGPSLQRMAMSVHDGAEDQYFSASSQMSSPTHSDVENRERMERSGEPIEAQLKNILKLFHSGKYLEVTKMSPKVETRLLGEKEALQNKVKKLTKKIQEVDRQKDKLRSVYEQSRAELISKTFDMQPFEDALNRLIAPQLSTAEGSKKPLRARDVEFSESDDECSKKPLRARDVEFSDSDVECSKKPMRARDVEFSDSDVEGGRFNYDDVHYSDSDAEGSKKPMPIADYEYSD